MKKIIPLPKREQTSEKRAVPGKVIKLPITARRKQKISDYIDHLLATAEAGYPGEGWPEETAEDFERKAQIERLMKASFSGQLPIEP